MEARRHVEVTGVELASGTKLVGNAELDSAQRAGWGDTGDGGTKGEWAQQWWRRGLVWAQQLRRGQVGTTAMAQRVVWTQGKVATMT
jgi:hypothetical protein